MEPNFTQTITFRSDHPETLIALAREWDELQASEEVMGFMGVRILADREDPGRYVMIADFGAVDPELSAAQEAFLNNVRPQTEAFAERFPCYRYRRARMAPLRRAVPHTVRVADFAQSMRWVHTSAAAAAAHNAMSAAPMNHTVRDCCFES
jgi:hypothetical protein